MFDDPSLMKGLTTNQKGELVSQFELVRVVSEWSDTVVFIHHCAKGFISMSIDEYGRLPARTSEALTVWHQYANAHSDSKEKEMLSMLMAMKGQR